jgi:hypothetical protein
MSQWYRVFGSNDVQPAPAALLEQVRALGVPVTGRFQGDDLGWFRGDLGIGEDAMPLPIERYLGSEEGIRAELNTWAAWLESAGESPVHLRLMQHMIGTTQVFTLGPIDPDDEPAAGPVCLALCRFLAGATAGVYQADGLGFFDPAGALLVPESQPLAG